MTGQQMKAQTRVITILTISAIFLALGMFVWPTRYKYDHINLQGNVLPVRIDRFTDKTELLDASGWHEAVGSVNTLSNQIQALPPDALNKLDVQIKASPSEILNNNSYSIISCWIY